MSSGNEILYIKGEKNTEVKEPNVTLGDILTMECSNSSIMNRIKPLRILKIPKKEQHRYVVSVLKIIECIHREIPGLQIQNEGESDLIITYEGEKKRNAIWQGIKVVVVAGITFIGAAFSIMAFNNDVSVTKMFSRIYLLLTGEESNELCHTSDRQKYLKNITGSKSQCHQFIKAVPKLHRNIQKHHINTDTYQDQTKCKNQSHFLRNCRKNEI